MEFDIMRIIATLINFGLLIGIFLLIIKFIKWLKNIGKRLGSIENSIEKIKKEIEEK